MEEWRVIQEYPQYEVGHSGEVRNWETGRILTPRATRSGRAAMAQIAILNDDRRQVHLSLSRLVAETWLGPHEWSHYDTPINLNGDRFDCRVDNLQWRPRWYAIQYHMQFHNDPSIGTPTPPIQNMMTGDIYENADEAFMTLGLIRRQMILSILNQEVIRPDNILLRRWQE